VTLVRGVNDQGIVASIVLPFSLFSSHAPSVTPSAARPTAEPVAAPIEVAPAGAIVDRSVSDESMIDSSEMVTAAASALDPLPDMVDSQVAVGQLLADRPLDTPGRRDDRPPTLKTRVRGAQLPDTGPDGVTILPASDPDAVRASLSALQTGVQRAAQGEIDELEAMVAEPDAMELDDFAGDVVEAPSTPMAEEASRLVARVRGAQMPDTGPALAAEQIRPNAEGVRSALGGLQRGLEAGRAQQAAAADES
jgi:hypothetical protein